MHKGHKHRRAFVAPSALMAICRLGILVIASGLMIGQAAADQTSQPAPTIVNPTRIETETVFITDGGAYPSEIARPVGKFFLHLINKTRHSTLTLSVESATLAAGQVSSLSQAIDLASFQSKKTIVGVFDAPAGEYQIKSQATGKVLFT